MHVEQLNIMYNPAPVLKDERYHVAQWALLWRSTAPSTGSFMTKVHFDGVMYTVWPGNIVEETIEERIN